MTVRKYCQKDVHKLFDLDLKTTYKVAKKKMPGLNQMTFYRAKKSYIPQLSTPQNPPITNNVTIANIPLYDNINIKSLLKNWAIDQLFTKSKFAGQAATQLLAKEEFLEQGEIKHGVYWTSDMPPYRRPDFFYPWQNTGVDLMKLGHCMWQASRQKIGKTTGAFCADFEEMLEKPGTVITLVAPGLEQAIILLRQGFKEIITLDNGSKFDLWNQLYRPYFIIDNVKKMVMKNNSILQVIALSEFTTPGLATDVLHIEEIDKAVSDPQKLRALAALLPTIRARRDYAKIRITCNNKSGIYRILREELKRFGPYFPIYLEVANPGKFTGNHIIYNEDIEVSGKPDIDEVLKIFLDTLIGSGYSAQQLGNVDDFSGELWNPDKLELAYEKGRHTELKAMYPHVGMGVDPGAIHAFVATIYAFENNQVYHLWTGRFSIAGKTEGEQKKMLEYIAQKIAYAYARFHCEFIASESNSGAHLIIPYIQNFVDEYVNTSEGRSFAKWHLIWSNFGGDSQVSGKQISRADFISMMQFLIDFEQITFQDRNDPEHIQHIEFARYNPETEEKSEKTFKGDSVDASMHCCWWLCGGWEFMNKISGKIRKEVDLKL